MRTYDEDRPVDDTRLGAHGFVLIYDQYYDTDRVKYALSAIQVSPTTLESTLRMCTNQDGYHWTVVFRLIQICL